MKTIFHHRVELADGAGLMGPANVFKVEPIEVLAENNGYIVINDFSFTSISKAKRDYDTCLDKNDFSFQTADKFWGNRIAFTRYSFSRMSAKCIRNKIEAEIKRRFGFFTTALDLSVIKD